MRDFTKLLKNKFKSKKYFEKQNLSRLGYLPVKSSEMASLVASAASEVPASPSLSPQRTASKQDGNERLADRLNELDTRSGNFSYKNSTIIVKKKFKSIFSLLIILFCRI